MDKLMPQIFITTLITVVLVAYYLLMLKPNQDAKNKAKQEAKKRTEIDELFKRDEFHFFRKERDCKNFSSTEIML